MSNGKKGNAARIEVRTVEDHQLSLSVTGMTCAACVASVEKVLGELSGVVNVSVNLPLEKAVITLDEGIDTDDRARCIAAVQSAGFGAGELVPALETRRINEGKVAAQRRQVALAFTLAIPVFVLSMVVDDLGQLGSFDLRLTLAMFTALPVYAYCGCLLYTSPSPRDS